MLTATKRLLAEVVNRSRTGKKGPYAAYYVHVQPGASFVGELDAISAPDHKHAGHPFFAMQLVFMGVNYIFPLSYLRLSFLPASETLRTRPSLYLHFRKIETSSLELQAKYYLAVCHHIHHIIF